MKEGIHPQWYPEATVTCACGNTWTTGATVADIRVDICSACHPFFTGERRIVDTEGQVDRFYKRLQARDEIQADADERDAARTSPDVAITDLGLSTRYINVLNQNGIRIVGDVLTLMDESGDDGLLNLSGFGRKALAELKKKLRQRGYELPESALEA
ncbi:MAG: 50S ribosomal protein L31 [Anaerolineae bacterium]|nr:50S ribosomal protein L31 [Anaerolineae bacterium]